MRNGIIMRRPLLWGLLVLLVAVCGGLAAWSSLGGRFGRTSEWWANSNQSGSSLEMLGAYGEVPDFALTERSGRQISRADLFGKVWIADFFYTECPDVCPLLSTHMARLQDALAQAPDVRLVSISVDPEHDTPETLRAYGKDLGVKPERWTLLTGDPVTVRTVVVDGFKTPLERAVATPASQIAHTGKVVLVDGSGGIRGYYDTDETGLNEVFNRAQHVLR
jgi:protein SCO1/2